MVTAPTPNGKSPQGMPALSIAAQQIVKIFEGLPLETRTLFVPKCKEFFIDEPALPQVVVEKCPDLAEGIAELLGRGHLSPKKKLPDVPNVMHNETLTILSNPGIHASLNAYHSAQSRQDIDWKRGDQLPTFRFQSEHGTVFVELRPPGRIPDDDYQLSHEEHQALWAQFTGRLNGEAVPRITSLTGDVLLSLTAQQMGAAPDAFGRYLITAEKILNYRDIEKVTKDRGNRTAGHRTEDIQAIGACMRQLNNTWLLLNVEIIDDTDPRGKKRRVEYRRHSRLVVIHETITQREVINGSTSTMAVAWTFQMGTWADEFLKGSNRFTAELIQQCLKYDPYHDLWEKRLSENLTMFLRTNAKNGYTLRRQIGPLLYSLSLPIDHANPTYTRRKFERAMNRIRDDGVIGEWRYRDGKYEPKRYGWLADWLNLYIDVESSVEAQEQYRQIAEKSETRRQRAEVLESAQLAKQKQRKEKGKGRS